MYECPAGSYGVSDETTAVCSPCHYTCLTCSGSSDTDCTSCHEDAELLPYQSRCILKELSWTMQSTLWFHRMIVLFSVNLVCFAVWMIYMAVKWYRQRRNSTDFYKYSAVSYSSNGSTRKDIDRLQGNDDPSDSE